MLNIFSLKKGAILKIVYGCNHKCYFCHERDNIFSFNFKNILLKDLEKIYFWIEKNNFDYVIISGGEPSLHPNFVEIIKYFQDKNIYVVVVTNGTKLNKFDFSSINKEKITFYISFHGLKENYNDITGSNDFLKVSSNIKKLQNIFPEIILRYVVNNKNEKYFTDFTKFVLNNFPNVFLEYVLVEDLKNEHVEKTIISLKDFYHLVFKYIKLNRILLDGGIGCINNFLYNNMEKKFDPLVNSMVGLVKKTKNGELLFNIKKVTSTQNIKSNMKKCLKCEKNKYCHGCDIKYFIK